MTTTPRPELFRKFVLASIDVKIPEGFELADWNGQTCFVVDGGAFMGLVQLVEGKSRRRYARGCTMLWHTIADNTPEAIANWLTVNLEELATMMRDRA